MIKKILSALAAVLFCAPIAFSAIELREEGVSVGKNVARVNCVGSGLTCSANGIDGTINASASSGDITSVGDVTTGAAFDGTQGTILTFNDTDGDQTFDYDTSNNRFRISDDFVLQTEVDLSAASGILTMASIGNSSNESIVFDMETADTVTAIYNPISEGTLELSAGNRNAQSMISLIDGTLDHIDFERSLIAFTQSTSLTIADSGDSSPGVDTTSVPSRTYTKITCSDSDGCEWTLGETNMLNGIFAIVQNIGANPTTIKKSAGVTDIFFDIPLAQYETALLIYTGSQWTVLSTYGSDKTFDEVTVTDESYDATGWNGDPTVPTKNSIRDKLETMNGTPGGSDTQCQFNDGGSFGGDAGCTYNKTTNALTLLGTLSASSVSTDPVANPAYQFFDVDGTDADINGQIDGNLTDTGSGTEDFDISIKQQIAGTLTEVMAFDADGSIGIYQPLQLGQNGEDGQLVIYNELGGTDYTNTFNPSASQTGSVTYTLPVDDGTANQRLTTDGSGVLSWATVSSGTITGTDTHVMFFDGTDNPAGDSGFTYNKTTDSGSLAGDLTIGGHDLVMGTSSAGVTLTDNGDGQLTIAAKGNGSQENLVLNLDDTSNTATVSSGTGVNIVAYTSMGIRVDNDMLMRFGSGANTDMSWESSNTVDDFQIGVRVGSNSLGGFMSLMERPDMGDANRSPAAFASNPTLRIWSADATDNNGYLDIYHDETNAYIDLGSGLLNIMDQVQLGQAGTDGSLKIFSEDGATDHSTIFQPATQTQDVTYTLPPDDGDASEVLTTNGSGVLTWEAVSGGSGDSITVNTTAATDANFKNGDIDFSIDTGTSPDDITATVGCTDCVDLGTETSGNYAAGDAEAGNVAADKVLESSLKAVDSASDEDILTYEITTGDFEWHTMDQQIANMSAGALPNDSVLEADLKAVDSASDEECLTFETTTGDFEWQACGGTDTNAEKEYVWPASATLPLEAADSIPPIGKDAGTNIDQLYVAFDSSVDECRTVNFKVPSDVTSGTVTFKVNWYSAAATSGAAAWDFRHNGGVSTGTDPDQSLTLEFIESDTTAGTAGQLNIASGTETIANLGWSANEQVDGVFCRDGDGTNGTDDLSGDALATQFSIQIPRA